MVTMTRRWYVVCDGYVGLFALYPTVYPLKNLLKVARKNSSCPSIEQGIHVVSVCGLEF